MKNDKAQTEDIADVLKWLYARGINIHGRDAGIEAKLIRIREASK